MASAPNFEYFADMPAAMPMEFYSKPKSKLPDDLPPVSLPSELARKYAENLAVSLPEVTSIPSVQTLNSELAEVYGAAPRSVKAVTRRAVPMVASSIATGAIVYGVQSAYPAAGIIPTPLANQAVRTAVKGTVSVAKAAFRPMLKTFRIIKQTPTIIKRATPVAAKYTRGQSPTRAPSPIQWLDG